MKRLVPIVVLALGMVAAPRGALAVPITGSISFGGAWAPTGGTGVADATGVDVLGDAAFVNCALSSSCTGSYAGLAGPIVAAYNDFTFNPLGGGVTPLWSFLYGGLTYSFDLSSVTKIEQDASFLNLLGRGMLHITGFEDTVGKWSFSGDTSGGVFSFSATNSVPEPASMLLLGLGLLGTASAARRRLVSRRGSL